MAVIVAAVSIFVVGVGIFGLASPSGIAAFVLRWRSKTGLWTASLGRLIFGITLWLVVPTSRAPVVLQVLAVLSVVSALALPLMGISRFESILSWWSRQPPVFIRSWSAVAVAMGVFLLWSVVV